MAREERGTGEGQGSGAMAVDDGVDLLGCRSVGDGEHVVADLDNAHGAILRGNAVDRVTGVDFAAGGVGLEPGVEALAGQLAGQHHGIGHRTVGTVGIGHAVQGNGGRVEVAFPVDAGGVDKLLVFGDALRRLQILAEEGADRLEVDVEDAVRLGQQAGGLGRSLGAQKDRNSQQYQNSGDDQ